MSSPASRTTSSNRDNLTGAAFHIATGLKKDKPEILFTFWGTPYIQLPNEGNSISLTLQECAQICYTQFKQKKTLRDYVASGYLVAKVHKLYQQSEESAKVASPITRCFIAIRKLFIRFFERCCGNFSLQHEIALINSSYFAIPSSIAREKGFLDRNPPSKFDSVSKDALYSLEHITKIVDRSLES